MKKRSLYIAAIAAVAAAVVTSITGCSSLLDTVASTILANEVRFDDRESPRTPYALMPSSDALQLLGGQGKGLSCSLPPGAQQLAFVKGKDQAPIALQMRQACAFHDYCYRHGNATYQYSQTDCDFMLQQQAFRLCKFINKEASISECETNARKVTLGVRLGGFGSFKRARATDHDKASTFHEFDPYPVRSTSYRVLRIADAPKNWGVMKKAAYQFEIRPSGSLVHVIGWKESGEAVCGNFMLPAQYDAINTAPMVVYDHSSGEDWFVWWKRKELSSTGGHFAVLAPGRATQKDWAIVAGGARRAEEPSGCEFKEVWPRDTGTNAAGTSAFNTAWVDSQFSEVHPINAINERGQLHLMALRTHSCVDGDSSLCLVEIVIETEQKQPREFKPPLYRAIESNCGASANSGDCDGYRNFVGAPFVVARDKEVSFAWLRRGTSNGDGYEEGASLRRYAFGKTRTAPATDLGELKLTEFSESMEPGFFSDSESGDLSFISLATEGTKFQVIETTAVASGDKSGVRKFECFKDSDKSWLQRPAAMIRSKKLPANRYVVLSRVITNNATEMVFPLAATLEIQVASVVDGKCSEVFKEGFSTFYRDFASGPEKTDTANISQKSSDKRKEKALEAYGRFAERVRGGQLVLADVNGDGVPDLVQIARLSEPKAYDLRIALLIGAEEDGKLSFGPVTRR